MAVLEDTLYLDNIEEHVQDDNGIATYKWLSRTFDVPVNAAKMMLYAYVEQYSNGGTPLSVVYAVSGEKSKEGQRQQVVSLVTGDELEATKEQLNDVSSVHIYSVQKSKPKHSGILYTADCDVSKQHANEYKHWNTIETTSVAGDPINDMTQEPDTRVSKPAADTAVHQRVDASCSNDQQQYVDRPRAVDKKPLSISSIPTIPTNIKSSKKTQKTVKTESVTAFFGKHRTTSKSAATNIAVKLEPVITPSSVPDHLTPPTSPRKSPKETAKSYVSAVGFKCLNDSDLEGEEEEKDKPVRSKQPKKQTTNDSKPRQNKKKKDPKTAAKVDVPHSKAQRKRRRVRAMSSDDDDSDPVDPTVIAAPMAASKPSSAGGDTKIKRRKRVRRLVPKLFTNDEGELVTERHYEEVSTDASSEEDTDSAAAATVAIAASRTKERPTKSAQKPSPTKGTKQSSLMSFFKK